MIFYRMKRVWLIFPDISELLITLHGVLLSFIHNKRRRNFNCMQKFYGFKMLVKSILLQIRHGAYNVTELEID